VSHTARITEDNPALADLTLSWSTAEFSAEDGIGPLRSLHEAGDALVAIASLNEDGVTILGSGVMVGPGIMVTATHVLEEFRQRQETPLFMTFLPSGARAWQPLDMSVWTMPSAFDEQRTLYSDISLVSCTLNSEAFAELPLMLAPMQIALPLIGERLWAVGFRHEKVEDRAALVTPMISSGLVTAAYPNGRGEFLASPCFEVNMDTVGGMSGGAITNAEGYLVGILSSSFEGGPSYVTLIWEALRLFVRGAVPKLQARDKISLLGAKQLNFVKIKGNVNRNPWGELAFKFSDEEKKLLADSTDGTSQTPRLTEDECDQFLDEWGHELEDWGSEATIAALGRFSLPKLRDFVRVEGIPSHCLEAIQDFSVEDFEGLEDLEIISTRVVDPRKIEIEYFFRMQMLVWTVEVSAEAYRQHEADFLGHFMNETDKGATVSLELVQRGYFRAETVFDREEKTLSEVVITSSAITPLRSRKR